MSRQLIGGDWHLGGKHIHKQRGFATPEEHHETMFDTMMTQVGKRDSVIFTGDVANSVEWLMRIKEMNCAKKTLVLGNHDIEKQIKMWMHIHVFDEVVMSLSQRNCWYTHIPMHPDHLRGRDFNIHAHLHKDIIEDSRFLNTSVDQQNLGFITFEELMEKAAAQKEMWG